jgi:A/G-specific adenine glycosylase
VSELLLRKTRADIVARVFLYFLDQYPTINNLSNADPEVLRKCIYRLGRMKRDKEIIKIAKTIVEKYYGEIPSLEKDLFDIIGKQSKYTVNAIRCFAYDERVPIFDVNVNRIYSRIFSIDFGKQPHKNEKAWKFAELLLPHKKVKEFNWALLDLGRLICKDKPKCNMCPLSSLCDYSNDISTKS